MTGTNRIGKTPDYEEDNLSQRSVESIDFRSSSPKLPQKTSD